MTAHPSNASLHSRIADALYVDAMLLADEARAYFELEVQADRDGLNPAARVTFSCESLRVTTRLMHVLAFLLTRRAVDAGELTPAQGMDASRRLGYSPPIDAAATRRLPARARALAEASVALHRRAAVLDAALADDAPAVSPALAMRERLAAAL